MNYGYAAVMPFKMHNNRSLVVHLWTGGLAATKELYFPYKHIVRDVYLVYNKEDNTEHLVLPSLYNETILIRDQGSDLLLATTKAMSGLSGMYGWKVS